MLDFNTSISGLGGVFGWRCLGQPGGKAPLWKSLPCQHKNPNRPFIPFFKNNNWAQFCSHISHNGELKPFYSSLSGKNGPIQQLRDGELLGSTAAMWLRILHPDSNLLCSFLKVVLWQSDQLKTSAEQRTTSRFESRLRPKGTILLLISSPSVGSLHKKCWLPKNASC